MAVCYLGNVSGSFQVSGRWRLDGNSGMTGTKEGTGIAGVAEKLPVTGRPSLGGGWLYVYCGGSDIRQEKWKMPNEPWTAPWIEERKVRVHPLL